jgi:hypothetical protein
VSQEVVELSQVQLDGLIARVEQAAEHDLALSGEDLRLLLKALLMLTELQAHMADTEMTLRKLRKLAGIVASSEKYKDVVPEALANKPKPKPKRPRTNPKKPKDKSEQPIHQRCDHKIEGLAKGQPCPECERGKLYQYEPALVLRITGQTPLTSVQHVLERLHARRLQVRASCLRQTAPTFPPALQYVRGVFHRRGTTGGDLGWSARAALRLYGAGTRNGFRQRLFVIVPLTIRHCLLACTDGHSEIFCRRAVLPPADAAAAFGDAGKRLDGV